MFRKITLVNLGFKPELNLNEKLLLFASSLGLYSIRDKDRSCYRIFLELFKHSVFDKALRSDDLARLTNLSRGTVVFHLNKMLNAGILIQKDNKYMLRATTLLGLVRVLKQDILDFFDDLEKSAKSIDCSIQSLKQEAMKQSSKTNPFGEGDSL